MRRQRPFFSHVIGLPSVAPVFLFSVFCHSQYLSLDHNMTLVHLDLGNDLGLEGKSASVMNMRLLSSVPDFMCRYSFVYPATTSLYTACIYVSLCHLGIDNKTYLRVAQCSFRAFPHAALYWSCLAQSSWHSGQL